MSLPSAHQTTRRVFLESSLKMATTSLTLINPSGRSVSAAAGESRLKIGLVGCVGRGAGAANQALIAEEGTTHHAMRDVNREAMNEAGPTFAKGRLARTNQDGRYPVVVASVPASFEVWY